MQKINYIGQTFCHKNPLYGQFKVIDQYPDDRGRSEYIVEFLNTGSKVVVRSGNLLTSDFKDPFAPNIAGVGYFGDTAYNYGYSKKEYGKIYAIWTQMMNRCYDPNCDHYPYYGALGVKVCNRWHNFSNFFYDFIHMPNFEKWLNSPTNSYHLDKDIKQQNVPMNYKVYSPETCELIPTQENIAQTIKDRFADNEYIGVEFKNNSYQTFLNNGGKQVMRAKFADPLSAAVYRECYAHYKYGMPMINDATKVPITMEAFSQAQSNRIIYGEPFPYKKMFELVDNSEPFDPNKFGYKRLLESSQIP